MKRHVIIGVGESVRSKRSGRTTLSLAFEAARKAIADCGIAPRAIDAVLSYQDMDACSSHALAAALGIPSATCVEALGGGTMTETLVAQAIGMIELGQASRVLIFRSMNGRSGLRMGGGAGWGAQQWMNLLPHGSYMVPFGIFAAAHRFALIATRHMHDTGLSEEALYAVCQALYDHAQLNPAAMMRGKPLTRDAYFDSPYLAYPFRRHDYCLESDEANAFIVTTADIAADLPCRPVSIEAVVPRRGSADAFHYALPDMTEVAGEQVAPELYARAGIGPESVDIAAIYDCFSWVLVRQLEAFGFVEPGESDPFVRKGALARGGRLPTNTAGGQLAEGYTHGMNNVLEIVRQLRADYRGTPRQVECATGIVTGWGGPGMASAMLLRSGS